MPLAVFLGIDIGTSGIRGCCIDAEKNTLASHRIRFDNSQTQHDCNEQNPQQWIDYLAQLLSSLSDQLLSKNARIQAVAIDGTSSTLIACDKDGKALSPALMYNDQQSQDQAKLITQFAPADSAVHGATSSLAKAMLLQKRFPQTERFCHQADWLAGYLSGNYSISDENNCLKLGYDSINQKWPSWLQQNTASVEITASMLPEVVAPGTPYAQLKAEHASRFAFADDCIVVAGTTDSNAAIVASGANHIGDAVTSLGSTLVVKVLSESPVFDPRYGIYSHLLNGQWLVGGASNTGGAVLLQHFSQQQLDQMTALLEPNNNTGLNYYPLPAKGERFPINDADMVSKIEPRPESDVHFFQALLEGIATIEADAYSLLTQLGASKPQRIITAGGGNKNTAWTAIRQNKTGLAVVNAKNSEASFGSALLARQGFQQHKQQL